MIFEWVNKFHHRSACVWIATAQLTSHQRRKPVDQHAFIHSAVITITTTYIITAFLNCYHRRRCCHDHHHCRHNHHRCRHDHRRCRHKHRRCHLFQPCHLHNWEMHIHFKVHGSGSDLYGDGFAIWYARDRMTLGLWIWSADHDV